MGTVRLWGINEEDLLHTFTEHTPNMNANSVAFSPDGTTLVSGGDDNTVQLWEVGTRQHIGTIEHPSWVRSAVFSPDGGVLATGSGDTKVRLWEIIRADDDLPSIDAKGGQIYWTDIGMPGDRTTSIRRANLDGTNVETLVTGLGRPASIALDVVGGKMYWTDVNFTPVAQGFIPVCKS